MRKKLGATSVLGWHGSADAFAKEKWASGGDLRGGKAGLVVVVY